MERLGGEAESAGVAALAVTGAPALATPAKLMRTSRRPVLAASASASSAMAMRSAGTPCAIKVARTALARRAVALSTILICWRSHTDAASTACSMALRFCWVSDEPRAPKCTEVTRAWQTVLAVAGMAAAGASAVAVGAVGGASAVTAQAGEAAIAEAASAAWAGVSAVIGGVRGRRWANLGQRPGSVAPDRLRPRTPEAYFAWEGRLSGKTEGAPTAPAPPLPPRPREPTRVKAASSCALTERLLDVALGSSYLQGMAIRPILVAPDQRLKQKSVPVEGPVTDAHRRLMDDMLETMYDAPGIGLAAIQVGEPLRIIVMDLAREDEPKAPRYYVNPEILWASEEVVPYEEGCLSVPDYYDDVERPRFVKIRYMDYNGKLIEEDAEGLYAVCIQHEMDHLEGVLFIDHLSRLKREKALNKLKKTRRAL